MPRPAPEPRGRPARGYAAASCGARAAVEADRLVLERVRRARVDFLDAEAGLHEQRGQPLGPMVMERDVDRLALEVRVALRALAAVHGQEQRRSQPERPPEL